MSIFYESRGTGHACFINEHMSFPPHLHKQLEFVYVIEGELGLSVSGTEQMLCQGECVLIYPNRIHSYKQHSGSKTLVLITDMQNVAELYSQFSSIQPEQPVFAASALSMFGQTAIDLLAERAASDEPCSALDKGLMLTLFSDCFHKLPCTEYRVYDLTLAEQALVYIDRNYTQHLNEAQVASAIGISTYYLSHLFSDELKMTFPSYLSLKRLQKAADMLENTDLTITEIALASGFSNIRSFNRVFRQEMQTTPRDFRKKLKGHDVQ